MNTGRNLWMGMLALTVSVCWSPFVSASWLGFRNDLSHPVVIRWTNETGAPGKSHQLHPGESRWEWTMDKRARQITITDAREPRSVLVRVTSPTAKSPDLLYAIQTKAGTDGKKTVQATKVSPAKKDPKPVTATAQSK